MDAIGTVQINDGGEGYRENPDLVFWYGEEENKTDLETFPTLSSLQASFTETNGTMGMLAYVREDDSVYSYHLGKSNDRNYTWKKDTFNGWRRLIEATGIGEFENASVGEIVWAKKMDALTAFPLPDGREVTKRYIDYVTMDVSRGSFTGFQRK